ncbi:MAG: ABC transporter ATP-binding protein [Synergistaceae bacterium]|nr:ABC transporter ATP-binding protein [Synergistaceae bacterium]
MAQITVENLTKYFETDGEKQLVLQGVNASFEENEVSVILGRSGVGKTVMLRIMAGLLEPSSGKITFPGGLKPGFVFQEARLMPWLSVWDNVNFGLEKFQIDKGKTQAVIDLVALTGHEKTFPADLSGGMAHRVALARMLICRPRLIFMDEPFSALDYFTRAMLQKELLRIKKETGMGVIFVTHNLDEAVRIADSIYVMSNGVITEKFRVNLTENERESYSLKALDIKNEILRNL